MYKPEEHLMIDLETTGISAGCGILSLGAVTLDLEDNFYMKVAIQSCLDIGLVNYHNTICWWEKQDSVAKEEAFSGVLDIRDVLQEFSDWFNNFSCKNLKVWGNGSDFDISILSKAFELGKIPVPWKYDNVRCYRTIKNQYKDTKMDAFRGVKHNSLYDARNQATHLNKIVHKHGIPLG